MSHRLLLKTNKLSFSYGAKLLLKQIDFALYEHQVVGLIGPNGAGKTTLLKCLFGYLKPSEGNVFFNGSNLEKITLPQRANKIAVVLQSMPENIPLTVSDILQIGKNDKASIKYPFSEQDRIILSRLGVGNLLNTSYNKLSGGQQQRVMIARALLQKPKVLILDEPNNHLDISCQHRILDFLRSQKITVVVSLHDLNLASEYCDQLALLYKGSLLIQDSPLAVLRPELIKKVFNINVHQEVHPLTFKQRLLFSC